MDERTQTYHGETKKSDSDRLRAKDRLIVAAVAFSASAIFMLPTGFFAAHTFFPRIVEQEKIIMKADPSADAKKEMEKKAQDIAEQLAPFIAEKLAAEKLPAHLEVMWLGLMKIEDNQATRAPHRQAGIKTKSGIIGFPKDTVFQVHGYVVENKAGAGVASTVIEGNRYFISFHWLPGVGGVPDKLKEFRIVQGKKIEIVSSK